MKKTTHLIITSIVMCLCLVSRIQANPADHLAPAPQASPEEKEVISLLQLGKPYIQSSGQITISLYNPTKYVLKTCVVHVQVPSMNIDRIYYSNSADIFPLKDGEFLISTQITNSDSKELKCEIIKLTYEKPKS